MIHPTTASIRRATQPRRGTTVTELAMILPVILLMLLGTIDFALVMYANGTVSEAARVGARYAVVHGSMASSSVGPTANNTTVEQKVRDSAPALDSSQLTVTSSWGSGSNQAGNPVTVTATYTCKLAVGKLIGLGSLTVKGTTTMYITY